MLWSPLWDRMLWLLPKGTCVTSKCFSFSNICRNVWLYFSKGIDAYSNKVTSSFYEAIHMWHFFILYPPEAGKNVMDSSQIAHRLSCCKKSLWQSIVFSCSSTSYMAGLLVTKCFPTPSPHPSQNSIENTGSCIAKWHGQTNDIDMPTHWFQKNGRHDTSGTHWW